MKKYPCRTEEISGTDYLVEYFDKDGSLRMSTSMDSKEAADRSTQFMVERLPTITFKITPYNWSRKVCIECGEESWA